MGRGPTSALCRPMRGATHEGAALSKLRRKRARARRRLRRLTNYSGPRTLVNNRNTDVPARTPPPREASRDPGKVRSSDDLSPHIDRAGSRPRPGGRLWALPGATAVASLKDLEVEAGYECLLQPVRDPGRFLLQSRSNGGPHTESTTGSPSAGQSSGVVIGISAAGITVCDSSRIARRLRQSSNRQQVQLVSRRPSTIKAARDVKAQVGGELHQNVGRCRRCGCGRCHCPVPA